ncbi:hypothetical protein BY996DRAFT_6613248 [Phakopsora pachyrhizi]|nr:hypothetical protein BY996DRAFT_6613248 [Phakopsora pachyrhizi]
MTITIAIAPVDALIDLLPDLYEQFDDQLLYHVYGLKLNVPMIFHSKTVTPPRSNLMEIDINLDLGITIAIKFPINLLKYNDPSSSSSSSSSSPPPSSSSHSSHNQSHSPPRLPATLVIRIDLPPKLITRLNDSNRRQ